MIQRGNKVVHSLPQNTENEILFIHANESLDGMAAVIPDVVYSAGHGQPLTLYLMVPWQNLKEQAEKALRPLIIFIQGSAWTHPNVFYQLPQMAQFARMGYIVASITHRDCLENNPFPAFLQDVKTAIRFLRWTAGAYGIDTERIALWGTSSGGNAALLAGLTGDDPDYRTKEYEDQSDRVQAVISCFGPTDLSALYKHAQTTELPETITAIFQGLVGPQNDPEIVMKKMSPIEYLRSDHPIPSILLAHGDRDTSVPYEQSEKLFRKLKEKQADVQLICVQGAPHEDSFWSQALFDQIALWLKEKL